MNKLTCCELSRLDFVGRNGAVMQLRQTEWHNRHVTSICSWHMPHHHLSSLAGLSFQQFD